jgi:hypothetical protein
MESEPPGWYRDPRRPGMARYWDGQAWVDVDRVVDGHLDQSQSEQSQPDQRPLPAGPRLVAQRRSGDDSMPPSGEAGDEPGPEQLDVSPHPSEPESRKD